MLWELEIKGKKLSEDCKKGGGKWIMKVGARCRKSRKKTGPGAGRPGGGKPGREGRTVHGLKALGER